MENCKRSMFEAALYGDLDSLKKCVEQLSKDEVRLATSVKMMGGFTPLVIACKFGHVAVAEYMIDNCGADIELKGSIDSDGILVEPAAPLLWAIASRHLNVVECLLSRGANVNSVGELGRSGLHMACLDGHLEMVKHLIANGADIEAVDINGSTCLSLACLRNHYQLMTYLIQTDVNGRLVQKGLGWVAHMFNGMLLKGKSVDLKVIMAVFVVAVNNIETKIKCGGDYETTHDNVVLHLIGCMARIKPGLSEEQNKSFVEVLKRYTSLNRDEQDGVTPLHLICGRHAVCGPFSYSVVDVVRLLLDAGADPQAVDRRLNAPLHVLAGARPISHDVVQLLLDRGAHFDARNADGKCFLDLVAPEDRSRLNWLG